jgi:hypothetical protein
MIDLEKMAKVFKCSEPIFVVSDSTSNELNFVLKNRYDPKIENPDNDPILAVLANNWGEFLDKSHGKFEASVNVDHAYRNMVSHIRDYVLTGTSVKNPKQSKLYKWLRNGDFARHLPTTDGFIAMFKYIRVNQLKGRLTIEHETNVLMILHLMMEKYDK